MKRQHIWKRFGIGLLLIFGLIIVVFLAQTPAFANLVKPTPTLEDPVLRAMAGEMEYYDEQLKKDNLNPDLKQKFEAERDYAARQATE